MADKTDVLGECVFATWDGLRADGAGALKGISKNLDLVEFRVPSRGGAEYLPRGADPSFFLREVQKGKKRLFLFGLIATMNDAGGRPGFFGSGLLLNGVVDRQIANFTISEFRRFGKYLEGFKDNQETTNAPLSFYPAPQSSEAAENTIDVLSEAPPIVHASTHGDFLDVVVDLFEYLREINHRTGTVLVGRDTKHSPLSSETIKKAREARIAWEQEQRDAEERRKNRVKRETEEAYNKRTAKLGFERPADMKPEMEQYLINLMLYVLKTKKITGHKPPVEDPPKLPEPEAKQLWSMLGVASKRQS